MTVDPTTAVLQASDLHKAYNGKPALKGRFANISANPCEQYLQLAQPVEAARFRRS